MKKLQKVIFIVVMMTFLAAGCGKKESADLMDDHTYTLGCKVLEVMDSYNNMEIEKEEAKDKLDDIYNRLKNIEYSDDELTKSVENDMIKAKILLYEAHMQSGKEDLFKDADELRDELGK